MTSIEPTVQESADGFEKRSGHGRLSFTGLTIDEAIVPDMLPFEGGLVTPVCEGGHAFCYIVPGHNGELEPRRRRLNWAIMGGLLVIFFGLVILSAGTIAMP